MGKPAAQTTLLFLKSADLLGKFAPQKKKETIELLVASAKKEAAVSIHIDEFGNLIVEELEEDRVPPWLMEVMLERIRQKKKHLTH